MKRALVAMVAVALSVGLAGSAQAAKGDKKGAKGGDAVRGTVTAVEAGKITVQTKGKQGGEVVVTTDASTTFEVNGQAATAADVRKGQTVSISPATGTAQKVTVGPAKGKGKGGKAKKNKV